MKIKLIMNLLTISILLSTPLTGCLGPADNEGNDSSESLGKLRILTYDVFAISDEMIAKIEPVRAYGLDISHNVSVSSNCSSSYK